MILNYVDGPRQGLSKGSEGGRVREREREM